MQASVVQEPSAHSSAFCVEAAPCVVAAFAFAASAAGWTFTTVVCGVAASALLATDAELDEGLYAAAAICASCTNAVV